MPRLYDVVVYKYPGEDTDTVTSSLRYALERARTINERSKAGHRAAIVVDFHGKPVYERAAEYVRPTRDIRKL
jgi:hypothetical protein